ncbi:MAG: CHAT domain-containing tetratricopeptide repeat protein [Planctomycetota bacterium]
MGKLQERGDLEEAIDAVVEALEILEARLGEDHWETILSRHRLALLEEIAAMGDEPRSELSEAYRCLNRCASLMEDGNWSAMEQQARRALAITERHLGTLNRLTAAAHGYVASALSARGRYDESEQHWRQAVSIQRDLFGDGFPELGRTLLDLAAVLRVRGRLDEARSCALEALKSLGSSYGDNAWETAKAYNETSRCLFDQGRYAEAEVLGRRAVRILRSLPEPKEERLAQFLNDIGVYITFQGRTAEALDLFQEALGILRGTGGLHDEQASELLSNIGYIYFTERRYQEAETYLRKALDLEAEDDGDGMGRARTLQNLGVCLTTQGKYGEASEALADCLATYLRVLGPDHSSTATCLRSRAACEHMQGHLSEAVNLYRQALRICRKRLGEHHADTALTYLYLGVALRNLGETDEALEMCQKAGRAYETARWLSSETGLGRALFGAAPDPGPTLAAELARQGKPRRAWEALERSLARGLLEELSLRDPALAGPFPMGNLEAVQASLSDEAALVAWVDTAGPHAEHWACVIRNRGDPAWVNLLGDRAHPEGLREFELVKQVRQQLCRAQPVSDRDVLYRQRIQPLEQALAGVRRLYVIPSGWIIGIPVEVLTDRYVVSYVPSATILLHLAGRSVANGRRPPPLLAIGDPAYAPIESATDTEQDPDRVKTAQTDRRVATLLPLHHARFEVESVAGLFDEGEVYLGSEASAGRLRALAREDRLGEFDFIHVAAHAVIDPARPLESAIILPCDPSVDPVAQVLADEPLRDARLTVREILREWKLDAELVTLSACSTGRGREAGGEGYIGFIQALLVAGARHVLVSLWSVDDEMTSLLMRRLYANHLEDRMSLPEALHDAKQWLRGLSEAELSKEMRVARGRAQSRGVRPESPDKTREPPPRRPSDPYYWAGFVLVGY